MTNYKPTDMLNYINKIPDIIKNVELIGKDVTTLKQQFTDKIFKSMLDTQQALQGVNATLNVVIDALEEQQIVSKKNVEDLSIRKIKNYSLSDIIRREQPKIGQDPVKLAETMAEVMLRYSMKIEDLELNEIRFEGVYPNNVKEAALEQLPIALEKVAKKAEKEKEKPE